MTRAELQSMPCWMCWWREGPRCYSEAIYAAQVALGKVSPDDTLQGALKPSIEIYPGLPKAHREADDEKPCTNYLGRRDALGAYIRHVPIVIMSEMKP